MIPTTQVTILINQLRLLTGRGFQRMMGVVVVFCQFFIKGYLTTENVVRVTRESGASISCRANCQDDFR